jgi:hypothetical protein
VTRTAIIGLLLALAACDSALPSSTVSAGPNVAACVSEPVTVRVDGGQIFWNSDSVDEPELARRAAAHWCGERPYVIKADFALPDPNDRDGMALSVRVSRLISTKQAALEETLRKLADGTY